MAKSNKFLHDREIANAIMDKAKNGIQLSELECITLVNMIQCNYHNSGKIEGLFSIDSSAAGCGFCAMMQKAAIGNNDHICNYCYARRGTLAIPAVKNRHMLNMEILSSIDFTVEELSLMGLTGIVRFNSDGDFDNITHVRNAIRIAYGNRFAKFSLWTKNEHDTIKATDELGKPDNMIYVASSPIIGKAIKLPKYFDYTFTAYREDQMQEALENGNCECNGRKCMECGFKCYLGTWAKGSNIAEKLR